MNRKTWLTLLISILGLGCCVCLGILGISTALRFRTTNASKSPAGLSCQSQAAPGKAPAVSPAALQDQWIIHATDNDQLWAMNLWTGETCQLTDSLTKLEPLDFHTDQSNSNPPSDSVLLRASRAGKDSLFLLQLSDNKLIELLEAPTGKSLGKVDSSPSGRYIAARFEEGLYSSVLYVIDLHDNLAYQIGDTLSTVQDFSWSPLDDQLVIVGESKEGQRIFLYQPDLSRTDLQLIPISTKQVAHLMWSPDGKKLAFSGCQEGEFCGVFLWNLSSMELHSLNTDELGIVTDMSWSPTGGEIAVWLGDSNQDFVYLLEVGDDLKLGPTVGGPFAQENSALLWAPSGKRIAFVALENLPTGLYDYRADLFSYDLDERQLWKITRDEQEARATSPHWSADSQYVFFLNAHTLWSLSVSSYDGSDQADLAVTGPHMLWLPKKEYHFAAFKPGSDQDLGKFAVTLPSPIPSPTSSFDYHTSDFNGTIAVSTQSTGTIRITDRDASADQVITFDFNTYSIGSIQWSHSGKVLAISSWYDVLVGGPPFQDSSSFKPVFSQPIPNASYLSWSNDDRYLAYLLPDGEGIGIMDLMDQKWWTITDTKVDSNSSNSSPPAWSPDNQYLAFTADIPGTSRGNYIYVTNLAGTQSKRLTDTGDDFGPTWTKDGSHIIFVSGRSGKQWSLFEMNADGSDQRQLFGQYLPGVDPSVSPDGSQIAYISSGSLGLLPSNGGEPTFFEVPNTAHETYWGPGAFSWLPDSQHIVCLWTSGMRQELWVTDTAIEKSYLVVSGIEIDSFSGR